MSESPSPAANAVALEMTDLHGLAVMIFRQRRLALTVIGLCLLFCLLLGLIAPPRYRAEAVLMVEHREKSAAALLPGGSEQVQSLSTLRSDLDIIGSRALAERVIEKLGLSNGAARKTEIAEALLKKLRASNDGESFSIKISFVDRSPAQAAAVANSFADAYLADQLNVKYESAARANAWLTSRLDELRAKLEASEKAADDFRRAHNLLDAGGGTLSDKQLAAISAERTATRVEIAQAEARLKNAETTLNADGDATAMTSVLSSPIVQKLQLDLAAAQQRAADLSHRYGERHPKWIQAQAEIRDLKRKITEESRQVVRSLAGEVSVARAKEAQTEAALNKLQRKVGNESRDGVQLAQLQREADANRRLYEEFLNRAKMASEQNHLQLPEARLIARADEPTTPVFPVPWLLLVVGVLSGVLIGLWAVLTVSGWDRGFKTSAEANEKTGLPVFGLLPALSVAPEAHVLEKPLSAYSEALRTVQTALRFSDVDRPPKSVLVTSAQQGEGKTSFCLSFARLSAKAGQNVLLIDADLRRPRLAQLIGQKPVAGLADVLAGRKEIKDVLLKDAASGLTLLPALGRAPNAQDLLGSGRMQSLLQKAAASYDLVLIDAPPILAVSDSAMAAPFADATLFLVRWSSTRQAAVVRALEELHLLKARVAGLVLTQVDLAELALYGEDAAQQNARYYDAPLS